MSRLNYTNQNAIRNLPLTNSLEDAIDLAVLDVYGPGYTAKVYSGGQPSTGKNRTGSHRHDDGKAGDFRIFRPDGKQVTGDGLAPIIQYWSAKKIGGVGAEMRGGGIHLDEHATPPKGGGMFWDYQNQGGRLTPNQRNAYLAGKQGQMPQLVERKPPPFVPNREAGLSDDVLHTAALTLLGEAAGEGQEGMAAVAHVIKNRGASDRYPNNLKSVMHQPKQFSTWNKGEGGNKPNERFSRTDPIYQQARATAADVFSGRVTDPTNGGLSYFSGEDPYWLSAENKNGTKQIGNHTFLLGSAEKPTSALAAIDQISPSNAPKPPVMAYNAPTVIPPRPMGKVIADSLSFGDKIKYRNAPKVFNSMATGVTKVADALGGAGTGMLNNLSNPMSGVFAPTPPQRPMGLTGPVGGAIQPSLPPLMVTPQQRQGAPQRPVYHSPPPPSALDQFNTFKAGYRANEKAPMSEQERIDHHMSRSAASVRKAIELGLYKRPIRR